MNTVVSGFTTTVGIVTTTLNQPAVKEGLKTAFSVGHFGLGLIAICDIAQILKGRTVSTEKDINEDVSWKGTAQKAILVAAKVGFVLAGLSSQPGVFLVSTALGAVFSTSQLENVFEPNTIFAINPLHLRHVCSIASNVLTAFAAAQVTYYGITLAARKIASLAETQNQTSSIEKNIGKENQPKVWLDDAKTRIGALFTFITSRPFLQACNGFAYKLITRA